jgi:hypothetical protein
MAEGGEHGGGRRAAVRGGPPARMSSREGRERRSRGRRDLHDNRARSTSFDRIGRTGSFRIYREYSLLRNALVSFHPRTERRNRPEEQLDSIPFHPVLKPNRPLKVTLYKKIGIGTFWDFLAMSSTR